MTGWSLKGYDFLLGVLGGIGYMLTMLFMMFVFGCLGIGKGSLKIR